MSADRKPDNSSYNIDWWFLLDSDDVDRLTDKKIPIEEIEEIIGGLPMRDERRAKIKEMIVAYREQESEEE